MQEYPAGSVIAGKFRIERELGEGGFSCVYLATQLGMERPVALKIMKIPAHAQDNQAVHEKLIKRFDIEAKVISQLGEPSTITVYDYGETEGGDLYMALEYVRGRSLAEALAEDGKLAPARVERIVGQVLRSLREAHTMGIVHRDIKPGNIMIYDHMGEQDRVKVLDFGIAKVFDAGQQPMDALTRAGMLIGTPRYMAPELVRGEQVGGGADLYALGLTAYELLVGAQAVGGETPMAVLSRQIEPTSILLPPDPAIPRALREVVDRLMAKSLDARFATAQQALDALAAPQPAPVVVRAPEPTLDPAPAASAPAPASGNRIVAAALGGAILLVGAVVGGAVWHNARQLQVAPTPPAKVQALEGLDRIADELERSTKQLKPSDSPAAVVEPAEPAAIEAPDAPADVVEPPSQEEPAQRGVQKGVAKSPRRVEDKEGSKPTPERPEPDPARPADPPDAAPDQPVKSTPRPVETRIEHIELKYTP
jgi:eukaryotic-like serine/threonine-protein kinase